MNKIRKYAIWPNREYDLKIYKEKWIPLKDCPLIDVLYIFKVDRKLRNGNYFGHVIENNRLTPLTLPPEALMYLPEQLCL